MSAKVNLLPREVEERVVERQRTTYTIIGVVAFVALLGLLYAIQLADVNTARQDRDAAATEVTRLEARVAELEQYRQLADELEARNQLLATAMENEISWARVLNDLSLTFPGNASLTSLSSAAAGVTGDVAVDQVVPEAAGQLQFSGYSVEEYAPGVESVLIEFDKVRSFFNVFLSTAAQEEIGETEVTNFDGTVQLDEEAFTRRYVDGLPPEAVR